MPLGLATRACSAFGSSARAPRTFTYPQKHAHAQHVLKFVQIVFFLLPLLIHTAQAQSSLPEAAISSSAHLEHITPVRGKGKV